MSFFGSRPCVPMRNRRKATTRKATRSRAYTAATVGAWRRSSCRRRCHADVSHALAATTDPALAGQRCIEEAEERGARWYRAWVCAGQPVSADPTEVCRTARERRGER